VFAAASTLRAEESPPAAPATKAPAIPNSECLECHEAEFKPRKKGLPPEWIGVKPEAYAHSAHGKLACVECHSDISETPHESKLALVQCAPCHEISLAKHVFHPRMSVSPMLADQDTACKDCHGTHETIPVKAPEFAFYDGKQTESCGRCHDAARRDYATSAHGSQRARSERIAPDCLTCHRKAIDGARSKKPTVEFKLAQAQLCESCHADKPEVAGRSALGAKFVASFDNSVHGAALQAGKVESASCVDCHGAHAMNPAVVAGAKINRVHVAGTCAKCHGKQADEYATSVHAMALQKGNRDSASCTSCHGEHDIKRHTDPTSPIHKANLAQEVCAECHASVRLTKKYGLSSDTFKTFADSYHGLAVRGGAVEVVNCASCHGVHAIKAQNDPTSSVNKANLPQTCGECHRGANARFAVGAVHSDVTQKAASPVLYWIANIYVGLIVVVVGGMALHNLLDFLKKTRRKLAIQKGEITEHHVEHRLYLRMTVQERLQHGMLVVSFVALVVTGFMLRYPEAWWVVAIRGVSARAFEWRSLVHRIAGVVMLAGGAWHVWYLAFTAAGRKLFFDLLPRWRDLTDPWGVLKYNLGIAEEKPAFGRFCYIEKAEYWALVWGTLLMGVTGAILWFENASIGYFTKLGFDIARTVHFYEAVLATLAILVWHVYFVVFNPDVYPMNLAWLTGRMSEGEMMEEHPLQLEELKAAERAAADSNPAASPQPERPEPGGPPEL
jgi:cytochrome b subunit of formate dehydrogenase